ncbi:unnamed protein product [Amoebophrya sp. A120]|nr:unnamed protein product [Amoebophrya sp. A120]|eukprot:GSA120T00020839001.1
MADALDEMISMSFDHFQEEDGDSNSLQLGKQRPAKTREQMLKEAQSLQQSAVNIERETEFWRKGKADTSKHRLPPSILEDMRRVVAENLDTRNVDMEALVGAESAEGEFSLHLLEQFCLDHQQLTAEMDHAQKVREEGIRRWEETFDSKKRWNARRSILGSPGPGGAAGSGGQQGSSPPGAGSAGS